MTDDLTLTPWRRITLSVSRDIWCLVDAADYDWLMQWRWNWGWHRNTPWKHYAKRNIGSERSTLYLARELMLEREPPATLELVVDHINGQALDNRRTANLRWVTKRENNLHQLGQARVPSIDKVLEELLASWRTEHQALEEIPW